MWICERVAICELMGICERAGICEFAGICELVGVLPRSAGYQIGGERCAWGTAASRPVGVEFQLARVGGARA